MRIRNLLFWLLLFISTSLFGQIEFELGYFITDDDIKTECLIKNIGWKNNPVEFDYKLHNEETVETATIADVKEFGIYDQFKYVRYTVDIDRSSMSTSKLSKKRTPEWTSETLFLQVIIEGAVNLYYYGEGNLKRYFYSKGDSSPKQLIYKKYLGQNGYSVLENVTYQNQLWTEVKIEGSTLSSATRVGYKLTSLEKYFIKYHETIGVSYNQYKNTLKGEGFKVDIKVLGGANYSSFSMENTYSKRSIDYGSHIGARFGFEAEFILPFNRNKWALYIDPTYQYYSATTTGYDYFGNPEEITADISSIRASVGIRHYFYLGDNSKLFINISFPFQLNYKANVDLDSNTELDIIKKSISIGSVGVGYVYKRFGAEIRIDPDRDLLAGYSYWQSEFTDYSLTFSYDLLGH